jgi:hypothetical protein
MSVNTPPTRVCSCWKNRLQDKTRAALLYCETGAVICINVCFVRFRSRSRRPAVICSVIVRHKGQLLMDVRQWLAVGVAFGCYPAGDRRPWLRMFEVFLRLSMQIPCNAERVGCTVSFHVPLLSVIRNRRNSAWTQQMKHCREITKLPNQPVNAYFRPIADINCSVNKMDTGLVN